MRAHVVTCHENNVRCQVHRDLAFQDYRGTRRDTMCGQMRQVCRDLAFQDCCDTSRHVADKHRKLYGNISHLSVVLGHDL